MLQFVQAIGSEPYKCVQPQALSFTGEFSYLELTPGNSDVQIPSVNFDHGTSTVIRITSIDDAVLGAGGAAIAGRAASRACCAPGMLTCCLGAADIRGFITLDLTNLAEEQKPRECYPLPPRCV